MYAKLQTVGLEILSIGQTAVNLTILMPSLEHNYQEQAERETWNTPFITGLG